MLFFGSLCIKSFKPTHLMCIGACICVHVHLCVKVCVYICLELYYILFYFFFLNLITLQFFSQCRRQKEGSMWNQTLDTHTLIQSGYEQSGRSEQTSVLRVACDCIAYVRHVLFPGTPHCSCIFLSHLDKV